MDDIEAGKVYDLDKFAQVEKGVVPSAFEEYQLVYSVPLVVKRCFFSINYSKIIPPILPQ
jgi:hypothetical protein